MLRAQESISEPDFEPSPFTHTHIKKEKEKKARIALAAVGKHLCEGGAARLAADREREGAKLPLSTDPSARPRPPVLRPDPNSDQLLGASFTGEVAVPLIGVPAESTVCGVCVMQQVHKGNTTLKPLVTAGEVR